MAIAVRTVSFAETDRILRLEEGHFLELKRVEVSPRVLTKTLSAFSNTDGGELYIGIAETPKSGRHLWKGFESLEDANGHLQIFDQLFPLGEGFSYTFLRSDAGRGLVLYATVSKTRDIKVSSDGVAYLRRGAQNIAVRSLEARERLRRNKGLASFEDETVDARAQVVLSSKLAEFMRVVVPSARPRLWLAKQQLLVDNKPTVAAVLLFADEPQAFLPKRSAIKVYRYKTSDSMGARNALASDPVTVEGAIYDQIKAAVSSTATIIEETPVIGAGGLERARYPLEALHEVITNAVLHRDYAIADDVHVRVFDNRVEVESPGKLPGHVTVRNILRERFARNGNLVRVINKFPNPPNKDIGEGLNTAFSAMKEHQLRTPRIEDLENSVLVHLRHERLGTPEEIVVDYLETHEEVNNSKARELTGIGSENKVKRVFERLLDAEQIERVPGKHGRAIAYRRVAHDWPTQLTLDDLPVS